MIRRQFRVTLADRGFCGFMPLPIALPALAMLVPGSDGLHTVTPTLGGPGHPLFAPSVESGQIMTRLIIGAVFMGLAATIRELVAGRAVFLREKAVGLSSFAYLGSKVVTYGLVLALQCALMVGIIVATKGEPDSSVALSSTVA